MNSQIMPNLCWACAATMFVVIMAGLNFLVFFLLNADLVHTQLKNIPYPPEEIFSKVFLTPLIEELLFRAMLLRSLLEKTSSKKAIIWSSLIFSIYHASFIR